MDERDPVGGGVIALAEGFVRARERADLAALRECLSPEVVVVTNTSAVVGDRERLVALTRERHARLSSGRIEVVRLEATRDGFVLEEVFHGVFDGGRVIAVPSCVVAVCSGGQITSITQYSDSEAAVVLLDERARVRRLASCIARSAGRSRFTAVDVIRSAAALGLLILTPLDASTTDVEEFGFGVDDRAEAELARQANREYVPEIPSPPAAVPSLDLMALARLMPCRVMARGKGADAVLEDIVAALVSNPPFMRQLADAGIDPRPLRTEWEAKREAVPRVDEERQILSAEQLERLAELAGPTPPEWDTDSGSERADNETDADRDHRVTAEEARWDDLARRVGEEESADAALEELREELRFEIAVWLRRSGTNGRSVDEAFEDAMQAAIDEVRRYQPGDRFGVHTRMLGAYLGAIRGRPAGRPIRRIDSDE